jgi:hypothetical protein
MFEIYNDYEINEYNRVLKRMKKLVSRDFNLRQYKNNEKILMNLSFRGGWGENLWDNYTENIMIIKFVAIKNKKVGTIVSQDFTKEYFDEYIDIAKEYGCETYIIKNNWGMYILCVFLKNTISQNDLYKLCNETMSWNNLGYYYGYNDYDREK